MATILLVEDDQFLSDLYLGVLVQAGYSTQVASDAQIAIDLLDEYGADLIILDLLLPGHNGIEVLQELQSHSDWQKIPVVILSSQPQTVLKLTTQQLADYGVVKYLYKPHTIPETLLDEIKELL
jgi:DNA-binding response OmpR family regulator